MTRHRLFLSAAMPAALLVAPQARAQQAATPTAASPAPTPAGGAPLTASAPKAAPAPSATDDDGSREVTFSADSLEYDTNTDIVTATGDVRMRREGDKLRADTVTWNRKTGQVVANGNVVVTNPGGDAAYGTAIELTDTLKDGVVENLLVVLDKGGRLAANRGSRDNGIFTLDEAAYSPCSVVDSKDCPKNPSWHITALRVVYNPSKHRIYYNGARFNLFGLPTIPLPAFSNPVGLGAQTGLLTPNAQYSRVNGFELALPYYVSIAPNRGLTVTPRFYSNALPLLGVDYQALTESGAYRVQAYGTASRRTDATGALSTTGANVFRGYLDIAGRFQLSPNWSVSASLRLTTDRTFLRRYDISRDDLLRDTVRVERIDRDSYLSIAGWAVQTLRVGDRQGLQPFALPEIDYRHRFGGGISGAVLTLQVNTLGVERSAGQDTQRAFASAEWVLRRITAWGQEVSVTAYGRGDLYHADDTVATNVVDYRGKDGVQGRVIGALAFDVKWPFVGPLFGGTQRLTPRVQLVAAPRLANISVPNEDARAVDLEDSNLFALNRFPGYDRFEDSSRVTYGLEWALNIPDLTVDATVGQSVRLTSQSTLVPQGTGFASRVSDIVGRTEARYKDFFSVVHRYRFDKNSFVIRRNEVDATIGSRDTYFLVGYLRLNRTITTGLEDLRNRQEARVGGRIALTRFWSVFGSAVVDLTTKNEDPLTVSNGFTPIRHRVGVAYEDDCLRLGVTWKRDYQDTGDARRGNSFLLTLAFKNLGR